MIVQIISCIRFLIIQLLYIYDAMRGCGGCLTTRQLVSLPFWQSISWLIVSRCLLRVLHLDDETACNTTGRTASKRYAKQHETDAYAGRATRAGQRKHAKEADKQKTADQTGNQVANQVARRAIMCVS